jgi:hypothetical protein
VGRAGLAPNIQPVYQSVADATNGIPVLGAIFGGGQRQELHDRRADLPS